MSPPPPHGSARSIPRCWLGVKRRMTTHTPRSTQTSQRHPGSYAAAQRKSPSRRYTNPSPPWASTRSISGYACAVLSSDFAAAPRILRERTRHGLLARQQKVRRMETIASTQPRAPRRARGLVAGTGVFGDSWVCSTERCSRPGADHPRSTRFGILSPRPSIMNSESTPISSVARSGATKSGLVQTETRSGFGHRAGRFRP